jgi:hypothetical protein
MHDKFGLGTPRVLLELPTFSKWKKAVYNAANDLVLSQEEMKRVEELFRLFAEHKCRRVDAVYDGLIAWLQNAEREHDRKVYAGILATENPRAHPAVLEYEQIGPGTVRWECPTGATPARTAQALAAVLSPMLANCTQLHIVDPHFGPENKRHRMMLEALMDVLSSSPVSPQLVRVHCLGKSTLPFFEEEAAKMASRLPAHASVDFRRWRQREGGEKLHNRYVLTDLGGVFLGDELEESNPGQTDDLLLLPRAQYERRWSQYVLEDGAFEQVDAPAAVKGGRAMRSGRDVR